MMGLTPAHDMNQMWIDINCEILLIHASQNSIDKY